MSGGIECSVSYNVEKLDDPFHFKPCESKIIYQQICKRSTSGRRMSLTFAGINLTIYSGWQQLNLSGGVRPRMAPTVGLQKVQRS
jgi:hypothetical protein